MILFSNFIDIINQQKSSGLYKTETSLLGRIHVQKSLLILDEIVRQDFNFGILISTEKSSLSSELEKFKWKSNDKFN
jgi:hypothetical protein